MNNLLSPVLLTTSASNLQTSQHTTVLPPRFLLEEFCFRWPKHNWVIWMKKTSHKSTENLYLVNNCSHFLGGQCWYTIHVSGQVTQVTTQTGFFFRESTDFFKHQCVEPLCWSNSSWTLEIPILKELMSNSTSSNSGCFKKSFLSVLLSFRLGMARQVQFLKC